MQACLDDEDRQAAERREDKDDQAEHQQAETFTCPVSGCSFQGNGNSSDTKRRSVTAHLKAKGDTQHQEYRERIAGDPQQDGVTDKAFDTFVKQLPQQVQGAAEKLRALVREITKKKRDLQTARDQLYQIENSGIRGRPTAEVAAQKATLHSQISRLSDEPQLSAMSRGSCTSWQNTDAPLLAAMARLVPFCATAIGTLCAP